MAHASGGKKYGPLSPRQERTPMNPRLFTNLLGQALARQGMDASKAEAVVLDLMASAPPGSDIPERFTIHGVELTWPAGREARVLYPNELKALNLALARNGNSTIDEPDAIVRLARDAYETLWRKRNHERNSVENEVANDLEDALASAPAPLVEPHEHHWDRSPGGTQDMCACGATQEGKTSAVKGRTNLADKPKPKTDERPNVDLAVVEEAQADLHEAMGSHAMAHALRHEEPAPVIEHAVPTTTRITTPSNPLDEAMARFRAVIATTTEGSTK